MLVTGILGMKMVNKSLKETTRMERKKEFGYFDISADRLRLFTKKEKKSHDGVSTDRLFLPHFRTSGNIIK